MSVTVGNDLLRGTIVGEDMLNINGSNVRGGNRFATGNEDGCLRTVVVGDGEDTIIALGRWKFHNEVHGNVLKGKGSMIGGNGVVRCVGVSCDGFGGLASGTTADEGGDKVLHMGPPVDVQL